MNLEAVSGETLCPFASGRDSHYATRTDEGGLLCHVCDLDLGPLDLEVRLSGQATATFDRALDLLEFLELKLPARSWLVDGLLQERDLAMVHAFRGVGKSQFVLCLAYAVVCGTQFLRYRIVKPRGVLYVDGEMPREDLQKRLLERVEADQGEPLAPFKILAADLLTDPLPSLASDSGQRRVETELEGVSLIILDSISTLCRTEAGENEAESWEAMQEWLLSLRRRGYAVLLVHHDGKTGAQRGTSKREDVLAQVVQLARPSDYHPNQGARFEVHLRKGRGVFGEAADPFEAQLSADEHGRSVWTWQPLEDVTTARVLALCRDGLTQRDISAEVGIGLGSVHRRIQKLRDNGEI